jgi:hypothetical protein
VPPGPWFGTSVQLGVYLRGSAWLKDKNEISKMSDMSYVLVGRGYEGVTW